MGRVDAALRSPWLRRGFVLAAVLAAFVAILLEREAVARALAATSWAFVLLATVLSLLTVLLAALSWRAVATGLGAPLGLRDAAVVYLVGQVGKYLPGGVLNLLASAELGRDRGLARRRTVGTLLVAVLVSAAVAAVVAAVLLPGAVPAAGRSLDGAWGVLADVLQHRWLVLLAVPALLLLAPPVLDRVLALLLRLTGRDPVAERLSGATVAVAALWALGSWTAAGLQVLALALAVGATPGADLLRLSVGGYALAWLVGFVLLVLPAGVGAREAVLALALAPVLDAGGILVVVLLSRVLVTLADLVAAAGAMVVQRWWPTRVEGQG